MKPAQMKSRLEEAFPHSIIEVMDLTGTEDHYQVVVASESFGGLTRIQRQRKVMDVFSAELESGEVHALSIQTIVKSAGNP